MSRDFYFKKWKKTLVDLETIVSLDVHFQETKTHDKKLCEAVERLSGLLGHYMAIYKDIWDSLHQNIHVQKTSYMHDVLHAVVERIQELKHEIRKLEVSEWHFGCNGLICHKLTPYDSELDKLPHIIERPEKIQAILKDIFEVAREKKRLLEEVTARAKIVEEDEVDKWWENDNEDKVEDLETTEEKVELSEEQLEIKRMVSLIQAQERLRQVITQVRTKRIKRKMWEKALTGTLVPPARYELREKSAKLIQRVCRAYFESKRQKIIQCKRDELLGLRRCSLPKMESKEKIEQVTVKRIHLKSKYNEEKNKERDHFKHEYLRWKGDEIREHYRDHIRDWFRTWYDDIKFFHDIPGEKQGGAIQIFKEELPTPHEWLEEYKTYMAQKKANNRSTDSKAAKLEAKREELELKRAAHIKKKLEEELRRKMMKNPSMHPGYYYPESKKTTGILEVINIYYRDWADLDAAEILDVKERFVSNINKSDAYMEAKIEIVSTVEDDMRGELKRLKKAMKIDYENNEEPMPKPIKQKNKKKGKKKKVKTPSIENIAEKLEDLVFRGYLIEYPKIKIEEFLGDPNFSGDDKRCDCVVPLPQNSETRAIWWEKCRELIHGFHKILLIGPRGSGKNTLVHVLASMNDAVLFELDPRAVREECLTKAYLEQLVHTVASCAKAVQPSVIHIRDVHSLYYRKVPPEDKDIDWKLIQRYFVKKLYKCIHKTDKVTVVGTCMDPWLTKSNLLLLHFPTVVLLPTTAYGTVVHVLKNWVLSHPIIPPDLDVSCLAHVLQGYTFGFLKGVLERFLTADTIARIAAHRLSPMDVYDFFLQYESEGIIDYTQYQKWYSDKTAWGRKEKKHQAEQTEFKQAVAEYKQRMDKKKKKKEHQSEASSLRHDS